MHFLANFLTKLQRINKEINRREEFIYIYIYIFQSTPSGSARIAEDHSKPVMHLEAKMLAPCFPYSVVASERTLSYKRYIREDLDIWGSLSRTAITSLMEMLRATLV